MPLYDYECTSCGHKFELRQHFDEVHVTQCPVCQSKSRQIFHSIPILFKGSGFYSTDHKKGSASAPPDSKKAAEEKPKDKVASKTESKGPSESTSSASDKGSGKD